MSFLDTSVPEINVPTMKPSQYVRPEPVQVDQVNSEMSGWYDQLLPKTIKRNVSSAFKTMKEKILGLYGVKPTQQDPFEVTKIRSNLT